MNLELVPLLILALLLISAGGDVERAEFVMEGDHEVTDHRGALIVGDATVTVPADAEVTGPIYVIGGETRIEGTVAGDVTQLSGSLVVDDGATIAGQFEYVAGTETVSDGASVADRTTVVVAPAEPDPIAVYVPSLLATLGLALVGAWLARRRPALLDTVGLAAREHTFVSLTVGGLVFVTFLSVFVFMAFTLVLIPVALLGLLVGMLTVAYGIVALGYLVGKRVVPIVGRSLAERVGYSPPPSRPGLPTAIGVVVVMTLLQVSGAIPLVGDLLAIAVLLTGFGAVVLTYFGLEQFEPVSLPE